MVTERVKGKDGKSYPSKQRTPEQRFNVLWWVHYYRHVRHLSMPGIVAALQEHQGVRVSLGTVHRYLKAKCDLCGQEA